MRRYYFAENSVIAKETIINWLESYFQYCLYFVCVYNQGDILMY